jgi:CheY-like chemotaxis protein
VQKAIADAHVVYVDNDPMVRAYASEFLSGNGTTAVITADLREPDSILNAPALQALIDFDQPAGLLMTAVLHFVADDADPWALAARYAGTLVPEGVIVL